MTILAIDVDYRPDGGAVAAGVLFADWTSVGVERTVTKAIEAVLPYQSGQFFQRELPCILELLSEAAIEPDIIVVDGYVWLGPDRRPGLGAHLFRALNGEVPIVGVAKTRFADTPAETEVFRGTSRRPVYVTSAGIEDVTARDASCTATIASPPISQQSTERAVIWRPDAPAMHTWFAWHSSAACGQPCRFA